MRLMTSYEADRCISPIAIHAHFFYFFFVSFFPSPPLRHHCPSPGMTADSGDSVFLEDATRGRDEEVVGGRGWGQGGSGGRGRGDGVGKKSWSGGKSGREGGGEGGGSGSDFRLSGGFFRRSMHHFCRLGSRESQNRPSDFLLGTIFPQLSMRFRARSNTVDAWEEMA